MKTLKLTLALAGVLVVAPPLAYSAGPVGSNTAAKAPALKAADILTAHGFKVAGAAGAQTYEQQGGTLVKVARPAATTAAAGNAPH